MGMPPGGDPAMGMEPQLASGDMKMAVDRDMAGVKFRQGELDESVAEGESEVEALRQSLLGSIFAALRDAGVDPSNQASISAYLQRLSERDPDLAEMLVTALEGLSGEMPEGQDMEGMAPPPMGGMAPPMEGMAPPPMDGGDVTDRFSELMGRV